MKLSLRRVMWSVAASTFLAALASPLAAPGFALESSVKMKTADKISCPLCPETSFGGGLSYDADTQRCVYGGRGCDLQFQ